MDSEKIWEKIMNEGLEPNPKKKDIWAEISNKD